MRVLLPPLLALTLAAGAAFAADGDPTVSADCRRALDAVQARENALLATPPGDARPDQAALAAVDTLRRQAARACLGGTGAPGAAKQVAAPPIVVAPARTASPAAPPTTKPAAPQPAAKRAEPPVFISSCDADACWASDGTRLLRSGTRLVGPRGVCSGAVGQPLRCP